MVDKTRIAQGPVDKVTRVIMNDDLQTAFLGRCS